MLKIEGEPDQIEAFLSSSAIVTLFSSPEPSQDATSSMVAQQQQVRHQCRSNECRLEEQKTANNAFDN